MNSIRKVKKSKKNIIPIQNPQEAAKSKLIQFSNFDFELPESELTKNPDLILDADNRVPPKQIKPKFKAKESPEAYRYIKNDFKKITQIIEDSRKIKPLGTESDLQLRNSHRFYSVAFRNPLTVSSYMMMGSPHSQRKTDIKANKSQYIIRQQRYANKIKRDQKKRSYSHFTRSSKELEEEFKRQKFLQSKMSVLNPSMGKFFH